MTIQLAKRLGLQILPNGQLAALAVPHMRAQSMGEVDFLAIEQSTGEAVLRMRSLVVPKLCVDFYGGTTFHLDNDIVANIKTNKITLHGGRFQINLGTRDGPPAMPPPFQSTKDQPPVTASSLEAAKQQSPSPPSLPCPSPSCETILMKPPKSLIPSATYSIPLNAAAQASAVLIFPPSPRLPDTGAPEWIPQVCPVVQNAAIYTNTTSSPLSHEKNTHFKAVPLAALEAPPPSLPLPSSLSSLSYPQVPSDLISQIKINRDLLSDDQLGKLTQIHTANWKTFDDDMSEGFQDKDGPFYATFSFKQENKAPPYRLWCPQFSRTALDLLQAKCDQMESQTILNDPIDESTDIRHVSPCMISQKARAKHKPLDKCSLDEVRFIACYNVLNESIQPIPNRSKAYNDILKFLARFKYFIFADLANSYFQIKIHKKFWKYLAVLTPHRGLKILTRLGQGLLNSEVWLDQVMCRVLGDEMTEGFCVAARDDLCVGGDTVDECIERWGRVLSKLNQHNLKLAPHKVRILLQDTEVYGHRIIDGKVRPSNHVVNSLASTTTSELKTVKQVNSWKGLYKVLIRHLPHLASYMAPFDAACAGKSSAAAFDWSRPGIVAAFNAATSHLDKVRETFLPRPHEQLYLLPDTATSTLCTGWVLYTERKGGGNVSLLPVQYASAKLHPYMATWCPCELEGVGSVLAIDQVRHWINESKKPTLVLVDNKPVSDAANLMRIGRHSTNARLQTLLTSVNRSPVIYRHNSAKAGLHAVPDALSRLPTTTCNSKDCQVERFLRELPDQVQCMSLTLKDIAIGSINPATLAASAPQLEDILNQGGPLPLGSRQAWLDLQSECHECQRFLELKRQGQLPGKKDKDRVVLNKLLKKCEVNNGLIVSKTFDSILMKEVSRIYVPSAFLASIITVMHVRLFCPLPSQLQRLFERYFVAFGVKSVCDSLAMECSFCLSRKKFPKELDQYAPSPKPEHPGSHMMVDILRRASQILVINCDRFSNMTTATIADSESREDLLKAILAVVTPIRHSARVEVRTDRASSLQSLGNRPDNQLADNGITVVLGDKGNPNSNCSVDKIIQELEGELRSIDPECKKLSAGQLCLAVTNLNNRVRHHGLSASQVHFARDHHTGQNLALKDANIKQAKEKETARTNPLSARSKAPGGDLHVEQQVGQGDIVYLRSEGDKHTARNPLLVKKVKEGTKVTVNPILHSTPNCRPAPNISSRELEIEERYLYVPPHRRRRVPVNSADDPWWRTKDPVQATSPSKTSGWQPNRPPGEGDDDVGFHVQEELWEDDVNLQGEVEEQLENEVAIANDVDQEPGADQDANQAVDVGGDQQDEVEENDRGGAMNEEAGDLEVGGDAGDLPPEAHEYPPWPPAPRRRLLGISGRPMKKKSEAKVQAMDIPGRLVKIGESIKFRIPEDRGGERRRGVMSAIVVNMSRAQQEAFPDYYNLRTQDAITMSARLQPDNFWVWRSEKWYPGDHPQLPEPDGIDIPSPPRDGEDQAQ